MLLPFRLLLSELIDQQEVNNLQIECLNKTFPENISISSPQTNPITIPAFLPRINAIVTVKISRIFGITPASFKKLKTDVCKRKQTSTDIT